MRPSLSLPSFFPPLICHRPPLPKIKITLPACRHAFSQPQQRFDIRRWRGGSWDGRSDPTLYPPSQGASKGARLALARQGSATGSYRLNCVETLYAVDEQGRCLFQRMDLEEELETSKHGLMERPLHREVFVHPLPRTTSRNTWKDTPSLFRRKDARSLLSDISSRFTASINSPSSDQHTGYVQGGMSSSQTFSAGLCNLFDVRPETLPLSTSLYNVSSIMTSEKKRFDSADGTNNCGTDEESVFRRPFSGSKSVHSLRGPPASAQNIHCDAIGSSQEFIGELCSLSSDIASVTLTSSRCSYSVQGLGKKWLGFIKRNPACTVDEEPVGNLAKTSRPNRLHDLALVKNADLDAMARSQTCSEELWGASTKHPSLTMSSAPSLQSLASVLYSGKRWHELIKKGSDGQVQNTSSRSTEQEQGFDHPKSFGDAKTHGLSTTVASIRRRFLGRPTNECKEFGGSPAALLYGSISLASSLCLLDQEVDVEI